MAACQRGWEIRRVTDIELAADLDVKISNICSKSPDRYPSLSKQPSDVFEYKSCVSPSVNRQIGHRGALQLLWRLYREPW